MTKEQILTEALKLDPVAQAEIADALWASMGDAAQAEVDAAWLAESRRRDEVYARGEMTASPVDEVLERIRSRVRT